LDTHTLAHKREREREREREKERRERELTNKQKYFAKGQTQNQSNKVYYISKQRRYRNIMEIAPLINNAVAAVTASAAVAVSASANVTRSSSSKENDNGKRGFR